MKQSGRVLQLVMSAAIAVAVVVYAFSLDEWGDAGVAFPVIFLAAVTVAVASAIRIARGSKRR